MTLSSRPLFPTAISKIKKQKIHYSNFHFFVKLVYYLYKYFFYV